jgi:hypothetical protein
MMQDRTILTLGFWSLGMTLGLMAACAGSDTPARDSDLEDQIANLYAGGQTASVGGGTGTGGTAGTGLGGSAAQGTGGGTAGGAGTGSVAAGGSGGGTSSGSCDGFAVIGTKCGMSSCHGAPQAGALTNFALDEETAKSFAGEQDPSTLCSGGGILFNPDNAASSLVIQKMHGTASCGGQMPPGGPFLEDADIACVETWIKSL